VLAQQDCEKRARQIASDNCRAGPVIFQFFTERCDEATAMI
jgi:hypothetical protein